MGFRRGVQVEVSKSLNKDRGFVTKVDKGGKVYVELNYGGVTPIPYDAADLRILTETEQPTNPLNEDITNKGDRVLIFSQGLEGKEGTIFQWKTGKKALVMVDGQNSPIDIAYTEMELAKSKQENTNWDSELVWESGKNNYYYFPQENKISSNLWPTGLTLEPYTHSGSPIEFMQHWETNFAPKVLESLANPVRTKTLVLAQASELPEDEGKEFAADLIASLSQLFPQASKPPKAMGISFSRTINELISGEKTQTRRAWQDDYAKNFIRYFDENIAIPALDKGRHCGGRELGFIKLTQRPYQQYLSEMSPTDLQEEGGMVATVQEFIDTFFEGQDKLVWVLHFEFLATPINNNTEALIAENQRLREQLAEAEAAIQEIVHVAKTAPPAPETTDLVLVENNVKGTTASGIEIEIAAELPPNISSQIPSIRNKLFSLIEKYEQSKKFASKRKEIENLDGNIKTVQERLKALEKFEHLRIGHTICHQRRPMILGKITGLDFSQGEMPIVWVKYFRDGELEKTPTSELVSMIFTVNT